MRTVLIVMVAVMCSGCVSHALRTFSDGPSEYWPENEDKTAECANECGMRDFKKNMDERGWCTWCQHDEKEAAATLRRDKRR